MLIAARGLDVDHAPVGLTRRGLDPDDGGLCLDGVTDVHRHAKAHGAVLQIGACVLGDVLDTLAEHEVQHQPRRCHQPAKPVALRIAQVLAERVGRHAELGESVEQPFSDGLADFMAEELANLEIFEKVATFFTN